MVNSIAKTVVSTQLTCRVQLAPGRPGSAETPGAFLSRRARSGCPYVLEGKAAP